MIVTCMVRNLMAIPTCAWGSSATFSSVSVPRLTLINPCPIRPYLLMILSCIHLFTFNPHLYPGPSPAWKITPSQPVQILNTSNGNGGTQFYTLNDGTFFSMGGELPGQYEDKSGNTVLSCRHHWGFKGHRLCQGTDAQDCNCLICLNKPPLGNIKPWNIRCHSWNVRVILGRSMPWTHYQHSIAAPLQGCVALYNTIGRLLIWSIDPWRS